MGDFYRRYYRDNAAQFDRLVSREDRQGRLFAALNEICPLDGLRIVECGAGTGRLTRLLSTQARFVFAFDIEPAMLSLSRLNMRRTGMTNWSLAVADNARMPVASHCADLVIEGWSFAHTLAWHGSRWRDVSEWLLRDIGRMLAPGGMAIFIETLGTGRRTPEPPTDWLAQLYQHWQDEQGFTQRWIRTDYQFASMTEAEELLRGFFVDEGADQWLRRGKLIVPECTGIWWKRFD